MRDRSRLCAGCWSARWPRTICCWPASDCCWSSAWSWSSPRPASAAYADNGNAFSDVLKQAIFRFDRSGRVLVLPAAAGAGPSGASPRLAILIVVRAYDLVDVLGLALRSLLRPTVTPEPDPPRPDLRLRAVAVPRPDPAAAGRDSRRSRWCCGGRRSWCARARRSSDLRELVTPLFPVAFGAVRCWSATTTSARCCACVVASSGCCGRPGCGCGSSWRCSAWPWPGSSR